MTSPYSSSNAKGTFTVQIPEDGEFIVGEEADELYALETESDPTTDISDNTKYDSEGSGLVDFNETNPFGEVKNA